MSLKEWIVVVVGAVVLTILLRTFVFEVARVDGTSMSSTLENNQRVYIEKLFFGFRGPERGDIVMCHYTKYDTDSHERAVRFHYVSKDSKVQKKTYIKRIVGLPGETVRVKGNDIYINGILLDEPYLDEDKAANLDEAEYVLGEDEYFVCGDNRAESLDSRSTAVGMIPRGDILGRSVFRFWPLDRFGSID